MEQTIARDSLEYFKSLYPHTPKEELIGELFCFKTHGGWIKFNDLPPSQLTRIANHNSNDLCFDTQDAFVRPEVCNQPGDVVRAEPFISAPEFLRHVLDSTSDVSRINDLFQRFIKHRKFENSGQAVRAFVNRLNRFLDPDSRLIYQGHQHPHNMSESFLNVDLEFYYFTTKYDGPYVFIDTSKGLLFYREGNGDIFQQGPRFHHPHARDFDGFYDFVNPSTDKFVTRFVLDRDGKPRPQIKFKGEDDWENVGCGIY